MQRCFTVEKKVVTQKNYEKLKESHSFTETRKPIQKHLIIF